MNTRVRIKEIVVPPEELRRLCQGDEPVVFRAEVRHSRIELTVRTEARQNEETSQGKTS